MFDQAAHLVDRILPVVPFRQFVQAFPRQLKLRLAYDRECMKAARRIVVAAIFAWQRRKARAPDIERLRCGAISFVQRFSSSLACSPHLHLLVPDGVFVENPDGGVLFRALPKPTVEDLEAVAARVVRQMRRWLDRHELADEPHDGLAQVVTSAAEVRRRAMADDAPDRPVKLVANVEGFSLEAGRRLHENDREGLERLARYCARPPLAMDRITESADGAVVIRFKKPLFDGSTEVRLSPTEFLRRLASLVPRRIFTFPRLMACLLPAADSGLASFPRPPGRRARRPSPPRQRSKP